MQYCIFLLKLPVKISLYQVLGDCLNYTHCNGYSGRLTPLPPPGFGPPTVVEPPPYHGNTFRSRFQCLNSCGCKAIALYTKRVVLKESFKSTLLFILCIHPRPWLTVSFILTQEIPVFTDSADIAYLLRNGFDLEATIPQMKTQKPRKPSTLHSTAVLYWV